MSCLSQRLGRSMNWTSTLTTLDCWLVLWKVVRGNVPLEMIYYFPPLLAFIITRYLSSLLAIIFTRYHLHSLSSPPPTPPFQEPLPFAIRGQVE